jgi:hypothetical protein
MMNGFCGVRCRFSAELEIAEFEVGREVVEFEVASSSSLRIRTCRWVSDTGGYPMQVDIRCGGYPVAIQTYARQRYFRLTFHCFPCSGSVRSRSTGR